MRLQLEIKRIHNGFVITRAGEDFAETNTDELIKTFFTTELKKELSGLQNGDKLEIQLITGISKKATYNDPYSPRLHYP